MSTKIADDSESIARRLKEIEAEKLAAIIGEPIEAENTEYTYLGEAAVGWPFTAYDDLPTA